MPFHKECEPMATRSAIGGQILKFAYILQAALHALKSPRITSQVVLECTNSLAELGQRNKVRLVLVPGHCGVTGNEEADALARKGSSDTFTGPEPAVGLPYSYPQGSIDNWTREKCQVDWSRGDRVAAGQAPN
ncbi:hypothetical protein NQ315_008994 [Exocentrus adspersus]|uniref:RNase H type-1 domain-containing protein n=1 Tax=Exocentrus adspersus TaxID=1586481 RepID=A0AAV8VFA3_9CUCU|nr:hypothetical protein NQ315_008994 [Exocentrus adspersus]